MSALHHIILSALCSAQAQRVDGVFADYPDSVVAYLREQVEAGVEFNMTLTNAQRTCHLPGGSG